MRSNANKRITQLERESRMRSHPSSHSSNGTNVRRSRRPVPPRASAFPAALIVRPRYLRRYEALLDYDITNFPTPIIDSAANRSVLAQLDTDPLIVIPPEKSTSTIVGEDEIDTVITIAISPSSLATQMSSSTQRVSEQWGETDAFLALKTYSSSGRDGLLARSWDRLCWWLLVPGHIEFLFWTGALLLLLALTIAITLAIVLSLRLFCL